MNSIGITPGQNIKVGNIIYCVKPHDGRFTDISLDFLEVGQPYFVTNISPAGWINEWFIPKQKYRKLKINKIINE